jgi:hypothetical protein
VSPKAELFTEALESARVINTPIHVTVFFCEMYSLRAESERIQLGFDNLISHGVTD